MVTPFFHTRRGRLSHRAPDHLSAGPDSCTAKYATVCLIYRYGSFIRVPDAVGSVNHSVRYWSCTSRSPPVVFSGNSGVYRYFDGTRITLVGGFW